MPVPNLGKTFDEKFEEGLPIPPGVTNITFTLTCEHGRSGEKYAAKLAEEGNLVSYVKISDKNYLIKGTSERLDNPDKKTVRELLSKIDQNGLKYNCTLRHWITVTDN